MTIRKKNSARVLFQTLEHGNIKNEMREKKTEHKLDIKWEKSNAGTK